MGNISPFTPGDAPPDNVDTSTSEAYECPDGSDNDRRKFSRLTEDDSNDMPVPSVIARECDSNAGDSNADDESNVGRQFPASSREQEESERKVSPDEVGNELIDIECTICMEPISEATILPCQCKLHYCLTCWDKALANSFSQRGQATCPSCRTLVRVDFDNDKNCLVFSTETVDMTFASQRLMAQRAREELERQKPGASSSAEEIRAFLQDHEEFRMLLSADEMRQGIITRLRHQALPVQVNLLKLYGTSNSSLLDMHANARETLTTSSVSDLKEFIRLAGIDETGCIEKADLITFLLATVDIARICSMWASRKCSLPRCVCGCSLRRLSGVERFKIMQENVESLPDEDLRRLLEQLQLQGARLVICDICENDVSLAGNSFLWTCENRNSSILHATAYDICEKCFVGSACL